MGSVAMSGSMGWKETLGGHPGTNRLLLLGIAAMAVFPLLLVLSSADDNTLTSWRWAVEGRDAAAIFMLQSAGVAAALLLSRFRLSHRSRMVLLLLVPLSVAPLLWSVPEVVIDASRYFTQAKHLAVYGLASFLSEWGRSIDAWTDLPLPALLYGLIFKYFGESRAAVQFLNTVFYAATVAATYRIGRLLWGREAGFLAGLLLAGSPYLITQVPLMLGDVAAMFFLTLSICLALDHTRNGGLHRFLFAVAAFTGAFLSKYSLWPALLLALAVIPAGRDPQVPKGTTVRRAGALFLAAAAIPALLLAWKGDVVLEQIVLLFDYQWSGILRWGESNLSTFAFQVHPFVIALAAYGACMAARRKDPSYLVACSLPMLAVLFQIRRVRYLMVVFPLLALAAAYGLGSLRDGRSRRCVVYAVVIFSTVTALFLYRPFLQNLSLVNLKHAGSFLNAAGQDRVEVLVSWNDESAVSPAIAVPLLDIYTKGRISYRHAPPPAASESRAMTSPFRFSWRYRNPGYYAAGSGSTRDPAVALIAGSPASVLPAAVRERTRGYTKRSFHIDDGRFRYRTLVTVFIPPRPGE